MREIKFRAWDKLVEKMWDWGTICEADPELSKLFNQERYIVMQFTGLKDKKGKEIYEGDIIKADDSFGRNGLISWAEDKCGFWYEPIRPPLRQIGCNLEGDMAKVIEVIGNIYENPELCRR